MKHLIIPIFILCLFSCKKDFTEEDIPGDPVCGCGVDDARNDLPWMKSLINKSMNDTTGNYFGTIWIENYNGKDIFVTNMMFGSGGIKYWFLDCSGNHLVNVEGSYCPSQYIGNGHFHLEDHTSIMDNIKLSVVVYSSVPL